MLKNNNKLNEFNESRSKNKSDPYTKITISDKTTNINSLFDNSLVINNNNHHHQYINKNQILNTYKSTNFNDHHYSLNNDSSFNKTQKISKSQLIENAFSKENSIFSFDFPFDFQERNLKVTLFNEFIYLIQIKELNKPDEKSNNLYYSIIKCSIYDYKGLLISSNEIINTNNSTNLIHSYISKKTHLPKTKNSKNGHEKFKNNILLHGNQYKYTSAFREKEGKLKRSYEINTNQYLFQIVSFSNKNNIDFSQSKKEEENTKVQTRRMLYGIDTKAQFLTFTEFLYINLKRIIIQRNIKEYIRKRKSIKKIISIYKKYLQRKKMRIYIEYINKLSEGMKRISFFIMKTKFKKMRKFINQSRLYSVIHNLYKYIQSRVRKQVLFDCKAYLIKEKLGRILKSLILKKGNSIIRYYLIKFSNISLKTELYSVIYDKIHNVIQSNQSNQSKIVFYHIKHVFLIKILQKIHDFYRKFNEKKFMKWYFNKIRSITKRICKEEVKNNALKRRIFKKDIEEKRKYYFRLYVNLFKKRLSSNEENKRIIIKNKKYENFISLMKKGVIKNEYHKLNHELRMIIERKNKDIISLKTILSRGDKNLKGVYSYFLLTSIQNKSFLNRLDRLYYRLYQHLLKNHIKYSFFILTCNLKERTKEIKKMTIEKCQNIRFIKFGLFSIESKSKVKIENLNRKREEDMDKKNNMYNENSNKNKSLFNIATQEYIEKTIKGIKNNMKYNGANKLLNLLNRAISNKKQILFEKLNTNNKTHKLNRLKSIHTQNLKIK